MIPNRRAASRGFTIIEVVVTVAVLVILLAVGIPSFRGFIEGQAVKTASFDVFSGLLLARSEAVTRNTTVSIVPREGNWSEGWTISDANGEVVVQQDRMRGVVITGPGRVTYNAAGRVSTGGALIDLVANDGRAVQAHCIRIELSGKPVQTQARCR